MHTEMIITGKSNSSYFVERLPNSRQIKTPLPTETRQKICWLELPKTKNLEPKTESK